MTATLSAPAATDRGPRRCHRSGRRRVPARGRPRLRPAQPVRGIPRRQPDLDERRLRRLRDPVRTQLLADGDLDGGRHRDRHPGRAAHRDHRSAHRHQHDGLQRCVLRHPRPVHRFRAGTGDRAGLRRGDGVDQWRRPRRRRATGCSVLPETNVVHGIGYAVVAALMVTVALYGHATIVAMQKIVVPVVGALLILGVFAFAGGFHPSATSGEYALGGFWQTWTLCAVLFAAAPISYGPTIGDYTRRISVGPVQRPADRRRARGGHVHRRDAAQPVRRLHRDEFRQPDRLLPRRPGRPRRRPGTCCPSW